MQNTNTTEYIASASNWSEEMQALRNIVLDCGLMEEWKWKHPCYTDHGKNICIMSPLKNHLILGFFKGSLLKDELKLLKSPGEHSNHSRYLKFESLDEILKNPAEIKAYIFEAIEIEKAGLKIEAKTQIDYPEVIATMFAEDNELRQAFEALTDGRKRGYLIFFTQAKQSATRTNRIKKYAPRIRKGFGMNDCVCGKSKRMPNCDGSHKYL